MRASYVGRRTSVNDPARNVMRSMRREGQEAAAVDDAQQFGEPAARRRSRKVRPDGFRIDAIEAIVVMFERRVLV